MKPFPWQLSARLSSERYLRNEASASHCNDQALRYQVYPMRLRLPRFSVQSAGTTAHEVEWLLLMLMPALLHRSDIHQSGLLRVALPPTPATSCTAVELVSTLAHSAGACASFGPVLRA